MLTVIAIIYHLVMAKQDCIPYRYRHAYVVSVLYCIIPLSFDWKTVHTRTCTYIEVCLSIRVILKNRRKQKNVYRSSAVPT